MCPIIVCGLLYSYFFLLSWLLILLFLVFELIQAKVFFVVVVVVHELIELQEASLSSCSLKSIAIVVTW